MSWAKSKQHDAAAKRLEAQQRMDLEMQFILLCAAAAEAWQRISMGSVCVFEMHGLFAGSKLHRKALYRSIISMANMPSSLTHMLRACTTKVCRAIIVVHQSAPVHNVSNALAVQVICGQPSSMRCSLHASLTNSRNPKSSIRLTLRRLGK
jgi:hypothetical protein